MKQACGINLDFNSCYSRNPTWTNLRKLSNNWVPLVGGVPPYTPNGYPLVDSQLQFSASNYPAGIYGFSYTGAGSVAFSGAGTTTSASTVSGVTSGTVSVSPFAYDGWITMKLTGTNTASPMQNFCLMAPGYGNGTTPAPAFMPQFLQALRPFSYIRFLNWGLTNTYSVANWADRVPPDQFNSWSAPVPYEDMIELCNDADKGMWINIPAMATDDYVTNLATLIFSKLNPNLSVYWEYSNENWNGVFPQYGQTLAAANANSAINAPNGDIQKIAQQAAYKTVIWAAIFRSVFGSLTARVKPIMAGWFTSPVFNQYSLQFIQDNYGPPANYIYATAVAPYTGWNPGAASLDDLFAQLLQNAGGTGSGTVLDYLQQDAAVANQFSVPLVAYEGGQSLASDSTNYTVCEAAQTDPRMYDVYQGLMKSWQTVGGKEFSFYQLSGLDSQYGFWGMLQTTTQSGSQKYDAALSAMLAPGDANLDGVVDAADLAIVTANQGKTPAWWQDGDFDHDGVVGPNDLAIVTAATAPPVPTPTPTPVPPPVPVSQTYSFTITGKITVTPE